MTALRWILGALLAGLLLLALTGSEVRLWRTRVVAKVCDPPCTPPADCDKATGKCKAEAGQQEAAPACVQPAPTGPHSEAWSIGWELARRGEPDLFERSGEH